MEKKLKPVQAVRAISVSRLERPLDSGHLMRAEARSMSTLELLPNRHLSSVKGAPQELQSLGSVSFEREPGTHAIEAISSAAAGRSGKLQTQRRLGEVTPSRVD